LSREKFDGPMNSDGDGLNEPLAKLPHGKSLKEGFLFV
jgi:hypothetical protein